MKHLLRLALLLLVGGFLGTALLLVPVSASHAHAVGSEGSASATMSCRDNTGKKTRTVVVRVTWSGVQNSSGIGVTSVWTVAYESNNATPLDGARPLLTPAEQQGTESITLSFSDRAPFGFVQWYIYAATEAPVLGGEINASNFPGCANP
jgi:hypothetical protein